MQTLKEVSSFLPYKTFLELVKKLLFLKMLPVRLTSFQFPSCQLANCG